MSLRPALTRSFSAAIGLALLLPGTTALARDGGWRDGRWQSEGREAEFRAPVPQAASPSDYRAPGRDEWLADCRSRFAKRDNGVGGAVIGSVVGGVAGNRIAGPGNRTVGTVAGAAVGAVAGAAIDRAEDNGHARDECEAYLDDYYARYSGGYGQQGGYPAYAQSYAPSYGYTSAGCCMAAPVMMVPAPVSREPECTETVEYIYEDVPVRQTYRPRKRTKIVRDKRVWSAPDKRINIK